MIARLAVIAAACGLLCSAGFAKDDDAGPYPAYPELYKQVREVVSGSGDSRAAGQAVDAKLREAILADGKDRGRRPAALEQLLCLRGAVTLSGKGGDKETLALLLDAPPYLGRFLHALDSSDNPAKAVGVLKTLRELDEGRFKKHREFCIAFAVVWDDFRGYPWVDKACGPVGEDHMVELYKYFFQYEKHMVLKPWTLPFELSVFVVHSRVTPEERLWALQAYKTLDDPYSVYRGVPWTQKLSPAHGKGQGTAYTLANIRQLGGVCMEQAYLTEQVFRLRGVPAAFMHGEGRRAGGHAWTGVFTGGRRPQWDFSCGRYRYDRYYLGTGYDPTNTRGQGNWRAPELLEAEIKMTAAVFTSGRASLGSIERSYCFSDAARWAEEHLGETIDGDPPRRRTDVVLELLAEALKANSFNHHVWRITARMAKARKLSSDQAMEWANRLADLTLTKFPDYTVALMGSLLDCTDTPDLKIKIYDRMFDHLKKARADLACNVKVAQGDAYQAKGDFKRALWCYVYPMVNFSQDEHILGQAREKLEAAGAGDAADAKKDVAAACRQILKALGKGKETPERLEAATIIRKKLESVSG